MRGRSPSSCRQAEGPGRGQQRGAEGGRLATSYATVLQPGAVVKAAAAAAAAEPAAPAAAAAAEPAAPAAAAAATQHSSAGRGAHSDSLPHSLQSMPVQLHTLAASSAVQPCSRLAAANSSQFVTASRCASRASADWGWTCMRPHACMCACRCQRPAGLHSRLAAPTLCSSPAEEPPLRAPATSARQCSRLLEDRVLFTSHCDAHGASRPPPSASYSRHTCGRWRKAEHAARARAIPQPHVPAAKRARPTLPAPPRTAFISLRGMGPHSSELPQRPLHARRAAGRGRPSAHTQPCPQLPAALPPAAPPTAASSAHVVEGWE